MSNAINIDFEGRQASLHLDANGRYNLNDLHKVAGGEKKHQPALFFRLASTLALIDEIERDQSTDSQTGQNLSSFRAAEIVVGSARPGTFVVEELVYAYAMWVSPKFMLKVTRILKEIARTGAYHADKWYAAIDVYNAGKKARGKAPQSAMSQDFSQTLVWAREQPGMSDAIKGNNGEYFIREDMAATVLFACSSVTERGQLTGKGGHVLEVVRRNAWITGKKADHLVETSIGGVFRGPNTLQLEA